MHGFTTTIEDINDAFNYANDAVVQKADEMNEVVNEILMNGDKVEIYGVENENNLEALEELFYSKFNEAKKSI
jgi:hypothetical protein